MTRTPITRAGLGLVTVLATSAVFVPTTGAAADVLPSPLVDERRHPAADQVLAEHGLKVFAGDGNITFVDSRPMEEGPQCAVGQIQVEQIPPDDPVGGILYCFATSGGQGWLTLEIPGTFGVRGGSQPLVATADLPDGRQTFAIEPNKSVPIRPGDGGELPQAVLVELRLTGTPDAGESAYPFVAKIEVGGAGPDGRSCSGVLVNPGWVATTSACVPATTANEVPTTPTRAIVGRADTYNTAGHESAVVSVVRHPGRDLVLAQLATGASGIVPVPVGATAPQVGEELVGAGYGRTGSTWNTRQVRTRNFLVGAVDATTATLTRAAGNPASTCLGDAGGPLLRDTGTGRLELVALHAASWQTGCIGVNETTDAATETRVDGLADWIHGMTGDDYVPLKPVAAVLDTRSGLGATAGLRAGGSVTTFPVLGVGGVPATGVSALLVDLTVVSPTKHTHLTVYPEGATRPTATSLNASIGEIISGTSVVRTGATGSLSVHTNSGESHIVVDVLGYFTRATGAGGGVVPVRHTRLADTRDGTGTTVGTVPNGGTRTFTATGAVVPAGATGVLLDVIVTGATGNGFLTAYPAGTTAETRSVMDYVAGTTSQGVVVKLSADGRFTLGHRGAGPVHLVVTVQGYVTGAADSGAGLRTVTPARLLDTRTTGNVAIAAGASLTVQIGGTNGVPLRGATGVALRVAAVDPTGSGHLTVVPVDGSPYGPSHPSMLNFTAGQVARSTSVLVQTGVRYAGGAGVDGQVRFTNHSSGTVHLLVDLHGWYAPAGSAPAWGS